MNNVLQLLLSPLTKLSESTKEQARALTSMESILVKWDTAANVGEEIKQQTVLLTDIKQLLIDQNNHLGAKKGAKAADQKSKDGMVLGDASSFKGLSVKEIGGLAALVIGVSVAIVGAALILSATPAIGIMQLVTALAVAGILLLITPAFIKIGDAFFGSKLEGSVDAEGAMSMSSSSKGGMGGIAGAFAGLLGMLAAVVLGSYLLMAVGQPSGMQLLVALAVAILFIPLTYAFSMIANSLSKGLGQTKVGFDGMEVSKQSSEGMWGLLQASLLGLMGMLAAVVIGSYLLMLVGSPSGMQLLTALGVAIIMIGLAFALNQIISALAKNEVKADLEGIKTIGMAMLLIMTGMIALVAASYILQMINTELTMKHFLVALMVGITMIPVAFAMGMLIKALSDAGIKGGMEGVKMVLLAGLAIAAMAGGIVAAAWILLALPDPAQMEKKIPPLMWMLVVGLGMLAFSLSYSLILKAMKGATIKEMLLAGVALVLMALAILGIAWLFTQLPSTWNGPDFMWTLKVGVALIVFAIPFVLIALVMQKTGLSYGDLAKGLVGMIAIAAAVFVIAWIFSVLPSTFTDVPLSWSLGTAAAITAIGVPMVALATFLSTFPPGLIGIALAAVGIIIMAIALLAVAWIFSFMPDLGAIGDNLTNFILAPVNGIIDLLVRLKNEVGVSELIPLAIGIGAISVALLLLAGATAGLAAGGVLGALGNAASEFIGGITEFFGGKKAKGPLDILDDLIAKRAAIIELAPAFEKLAKAAQMLLYVDKVIQSLNAFMTVLVMSGMGGESPAVLVDELSKSIVKLKESFQNFSLQPFQVLMQLFAMVPMIQLTSKAMGELAKHFTSFAIQAYIAGVGLDKIAKAYVMMGTVTAEQLNPSIQFLVELQKDTYQAQADALTQMAPAIVTILGAGASNEGKSILGLFVGEDHPVVAILKALRSASGAVVSMAPAMDVIAGAFYKIAHSPVIAYTAATKFAKVLNDSTFDKQADALERVATAYKSIAESSNRMNIISIGKTTDMIHALGYLSKNGGQGAVDALGDKLVLAIEELGNLIEKYSGQGGGDDEGILDKVKGFIGGGDGNSNGGKVDMSPVVSAITNLQTSLEQNGIKIKTGPKLPGQPT